MQPAPASTPAAEDETRTTWIHQGVRGHDVALASYRLFMLTYGAGMSVLSGNYTKALAKPATWDSITQIPYFPSGLKEFNVPQPDGDLYDISTPAERAQVRRQAAGASAGGSGGDLKTAPSDDPAAAAAAAGDTQGWATEGKSHGYMTDVQADPNAFSDNRMTQVSRHPFGAAGSAMSFVELTEEHVKQTALLAEAHPGMTPLLLSCFPWTPFRLSPTRSHQPHLSSALPSLLSTQARSGPPTWTRATWVRSGRGFPRATAACVCRARSRSRRATRGASPGAQAWTMTTLLSQQSPTRSP